LAAPGPTLDYERACWAGGWIRVAGVDEVGRGALAGPLVAAAVTLPCCTGWDLRRLRAVLGGVRDSKLLTPEARVEAMGVILTAADAVAIGMVDADEVDTIGLGVANRIAMERAIDALPGDPHALLLDAFLVSHDLPQIGLIGGDARCLSIAAASIVAKVTRDRIMTEAHRADPRFGFAEHKGYGTAAHLRALAVHGPGPIHRRSFAPVARWANGAVPCP